MITRIDKKKFTLICIAIILASLNLGVAKEMSKSNDLGTVTYKNVNTKSMSKTAVPEKNASTNISLFTNLKRSDDTSSINSVTLEKTLKEEIVPETPVIKWRLPVEQGYITQNPSYGHNALDIGSSRGTAETIYPIADGIITNIYTDSAGGKTITIYHNIDGINYTSMYVHFSSYAPGIYIGQQVTTDTAIGQMGMTGIATGVHLHISVTDCIAFNPNDNNCYRLGNFLGYIKSSYSRGFYGLKSLIDVPGSWWSR